MKTKIIKYNLTLSFENRGIGLFYQFLSFPREGEGREEFRNFVLGSVKICLMSHVHLSVTSFSSHTSDARGLKIGMHNSSKVINQIFDILPRS